jgi:catechol-2,3-dioxygenase
MGVLGRAAPAKDGLFRPVEINHMTLAVSDPARSREYYRRLLGVRVLEERNHSVVTSRFASRISTAVGY